MNIPWNESFPTIKIIRMPLFTWLNKLIIYLYVYTEIRQYPKSNFLELIHCSELFEPIQNCIIKWCIRCFSILLNPWMIWKTIMTILDFSSIAIFDENKFQWKTKEKKRKEKRKNSTLEQMFIYGIFNKIIVHLINTRSHTFSIFCYTWW